MRILIDKDLTLGYELNGLPRSIFNVFFIPFLNVLPSWTKQIIQRSHRSVDEVIENATTHKALEVLYKKGHKEHSDNIIRWAIHRIWFDTSNSKAVRNRLRLVKRELINVISNKLMNGQDISILSIASGSARAIIESLEEIELSNSQNISVVFLDKNLYTAL